MNYYTLLVLQSTMDDDAPDLWVVEFGDYDKKVVEQERSDTKDASDGVAWCIIRTSHIQSAIDLRVKSMNDLLLVVKDVEHV